MALKCLLCGGEVEKSLINHLRIKHNKMTQEQYLKKYPEAEVHSEEHLKYLRDLSKRIDEKNSKKRGRKPVNFNDDTDKQVAQFLEEEYNSKPYDFDNFKKEFYAADVPKVVVKEKVIEKQSYKNSRLNTEMDKLQILAYLDMVFPKNTVENNFRAEKISICGSIMEYVMLTDIAIPSLKLDFEFPNAYWHNHQDHLYNRSKVLGGDGWKIVNVMTTNPSVSDVIEALEKQGIMRKS